MLRFRPDLEECLLGSRLVPSTVTPQLPAGAKVTVACGVIDIDQPPTGDFSVYVTPNPTKATALDVYIGDYLLTVPKGKSMTVEMDGRKALAGSTLSFLIDSKNPTVVMTGKGTSNVSLGDGRSAVYAGAGVTNVTAGNGTVFLFGNCNDASSLTFTGGAGCTTVYIQAGSNFLNLGSGFSLVLITGGDTTVTAQEGGDGIILVAGDAETTIDPAVYDEYCVWVG